MPLRYDKLLKPQRRVGFLDEMRGLCLILMVLYHGAYDLVYIFHVNIPAFHWPILSCAQPFFAGIFILISGACCRYSHNNLRRGLIALGVGLAMTGATLLFMPEQAIRFGILHFLGTGMILFHLLGKGLDALPAFWGSLLMFALCGLCWYIPFRTAVFGQVAMPPFLYQSPFLFPLGFPAAGFVSSDYFPLLPWIFVFLAGSYIGLFFVQDEMPRALYRTHSPFLAAMGRKSIYIYILHQPVIYGALSVLFLLLSHLR